jgi:predicted lipoprotein with Yx(FWY)xxD motif
MSITRSKFAPIAVCLAFGLAACGDDKKSTSDDVTTSVDPDGGDGGAYDLPPTTIAGATVPEVPTTPAPAAGAPDVVLGSTGTLGFVLADAQGNTLYMFANDGPDTPTCIDSCASTWPAFAAAGAQVVAGEGLDGSLFTIVDGGNGAQVSYNGHPLYYYSGDATPGDTNGQGVGGVWFVVGADGNAVT